MEFNEKLQELRKRENLTQEELAEILHVSRAAVSKWESGRGLPSIDSLKDISRHFSISLDDLLSSENLLAIAENEGNRRIERHLVTSFGIIDCSSLMLAFLPVFSLKNTGVVLSVSLLALAPDKPVLFAACLAAICANVAIGLFGLLLEKKHQEFWRTKGRIASQAITCVCALVFIAFQQIYAAAIALVFLAIKMFLLMKRR